MWCRVRATRRCGAGAGRKMLVKMANKVCDCGFITVIEDSPRSLSWWVLLSTSAIY